MQNEKGFILVAAMVFILFFTLLGMSAIHYASCQSEMTELMGFSAKAFWLADAGVEVARKKLREQPTPVTISPSAPAVNLGGGTYDVYSIPDPACPTCIDRWQIHSDGLYNNKTRIIEAILGHYDITKGVTSEGTIKGTHDSDGNIIKITGNKYIDKSTIQENANFSFETIFPGLTQQDFYNKAQALNQVYPLPNQSLPNQLVNISGVTWVTLSGNNTVQITCQSSQNNGILIVDASNGTPGQPPQLEIGGGIAFNGIIWVIGSLDLHGTAGIAGAVFVQNGPLDVTSLTGAGVITFDPTAVQNAIDGAGLFTLHNLSIIQWTEL